MRAFTNRAEFALTTGLDVGAERHLLDDDDMQLLKVHQLLDSQSFDITEQTADH